MPNAMTYATLCEGLENRSEEDGKVLSMSRIRIIREEYANGMTVSEIARTEHVDRNTVYKYIGIEDFSPAMPLPHARPSILDPHKETIDGWLEGDKAVWRKQRHTAKRVYDRLVAECGYGGSYNTVRRYVRAQKAKAANCTDQYLGLVWRPGTAQVDFGEADFLVAGVPVRHHYLVVSFPYSNMSYVQVFRGETAECVCQGLSDVFEWCGCVPLAAVFDNATGVGRRVCGEIMESELFGAFHMHYRFEARFCNPASGWEKGNVERAVGFRRSNMFVPVPDLGAGICAFNQKLLADCEAKLEEEHYKKEEGIGYLFGEDRDAMGPMPPSEFAVVRHEWEETDKYGYIRVDGCHTYSTSPALARRPVLCAFRAHTIEVFEGDGTFVVRHDRLFGKRKTETVDPLSSIGLLARKPSAWQNSHLREQMPARIVEKMDSLDRGELRHGLKMIAESCRMSGLDATMSAIELLAVQEPDLPDFFDVGALAARIGGYGLGVPAEPGPDLCIYDEAFLAGERR